MRTVRAAGRRRRALALFAFGAAGGVFIQARFTLGARALPRHVLELPCTAGRALQPARTVGEEAIGTVLANQIVCCACRRVLAFNTDGIAVSAVHRGDASGQFCIPVFDRTARGVAVGFRNVVARVVLSPRAERRSEEQKDSADLHLRGCRWSTYTTF